MALSIIPQTLALNAAKDATDFISKLKVFHNHDQQAKAGGTEKKDYNYCVLDLMNGKLRNNLIAGVLEPALLKFISLKFATEAVITILRIDDMIKLIKPQ